MVSRLPTLHRSRSPADDRKVHDVTRDDSRQPRHERPEDPTPGRDALMRDRRVDPRRPGSREADADFPSDSALDPPLEPEAALELEAELRAAASTELLHSTAEIAIVGRPNVGKSSLLNMLAGRRVAIVDPTAGVTRDRLSVQITLPPTATAPERRVDLVDTGGYGLSGSAEDATGPKLTRLVERQIELALESASLILFVVDAQTTVTPLDRNVAKMLRGANLRVPVLLVANKVDAPVHEAGAYETMTLGFGEPIFISATTGYNKFELLEAIADALPQPPDQTGPTTDSSAPPCMAIVGKRNAGKSTLVNALAGDERVIVSDIEGTTRDAIDVPIRRDDMAFTLVDTAGLRKAKSLDGDLEYYGHHRALRSIRRADVVLLLVDATVPVSQVDKTLAKEILKHFKPVVIVVTKWDLAEDRTTPEAFGEYFVKALPALSFAPVAIVSAQEDEGLDELLETASQLNAQAGQRVGTGEMNRLMERWVEEHPPPSRTGKRCRIYYATQLGVHPPTIGLFVNDPDRFDATYQRYLINRCREELPYPEVPIRLVIRARRSIKGRD